MATVHDVSEGKGLVNRLLTTDFCPWANRFVYWLKEPVGFSRHSCLSDCRAVCRSDWLDHGDCVDQLDYHRHGLAAIAVRAVACSLSSDYYHCHEGSTCDLKLTARNRIPVPIWGLAIEGYLDRKSNIEDEKIPTVALAFVRANSRPLTGSLCIQNSEDDTPMGKPISPALSLLEFGLPRSN